MEQSIKTATGKEYEIRFCGATVIGVTSVLYIEFIGKSLVEIVNVFSNVNETNFLSGFVEGQLVKNFRGYTNMIEAIVLADSGNVRIALTVPMETLE